jgi:uroporphyrinogen decarboxylase
MTPREQLIMALRGEKPPGPPPHLELVYQLFEEWPGVPWLQSGHLKDTTGAWRQEVLREYCEAIVQCAQEFDWCALTSPNSLDIEDQCRCMGYLREMAGETYMLTAFVDGTYAIPDGQGMYDFAAQIADNPQAVKEEAERRVEGALAQIKTLADAGAEIVFMCSDYCFNNGPFLSPAMFAEFVTPYLKQQVEGIHKLGLFACKHTDGQIMPILDQLVSTGIDALHSLDPMAGVDIAEVKRLVGNRVCLMGNVNCAEVQAGTEDSIRASALYCLEHGGVASGAYVYATSNCIFRGVPLENYRYMLRLREEFVAGAGRDGNGCSQDGQDG